MNATTAGQASNPIDLRNTGTTSISFTWNTNAPVTAGACGMQKADANTGPWTAFGPTATVTASGGPLTAMMVVNFMRFQCSTAITGTGNVGFRYVGTLSTTTGTGSDVNVTNPSLVVTQSTASALNATVTGTITANAGTGFAGVGQGSTTAGQVGNLLQCAATTAAPTYTTGTTNPCSVDTSGGLRVSGIAGGGGLAQGSMTAGQLGTLIQAAATTAAPTYTTGTTNPLNTDLTGALRVNVVASVAGGGGGTSSNFTAAFPSAGTAAGFSDGVNMQGARVFDVDSGAGVQYVQGVNLRASGAGGSTEIGIAAAPLRVDPTGTTTQPVSGTVTANAGTGNFTVIQPTSANLNATVVQTTGTNLHVVVDSAPTTVVSGTVTSNAGTGWFLNQGSTTAGQTGSLSMCAVTTGAPTYTTGQTSPCSVDTTGALRVTGTAGGTASSFTAAFPASGTAAGFNDGTNMQGARVFDVDSGAGTQYVQGVNLRLTGNGGSVEFGTATAPIRVDPTGSTTQPVNGTITANQGTGGASPWLVTSGAVTSTTTTMQNAVTATGNGTVLNVDGQAVAHLTGICNVSCAATTSVITLEAQNDGANFVAVYGTIDNSNTIASTFNLTGTAAVGISVQLHGEKQLRARVSTYGGTGQLTVVGTTSAAAGNPPAVVNANVTNTTFNSNITTLAGQPIDTNSGGLTAGTQRVVLTTAQPNLTTPLNVSLGTTTSNFNLTQLNGTGITAIGTAPNGKLAMATFDSLGNPITAVTNPCDGTLTTLVAGSVTADTQIITTPGAGIRRFYCSIAINNGSASNENVSIVESTTGGGTCTTAPSVVWGSTTDANGWLVTSNGGGFISETLKQGPLTNAATCLKVNTGGLQIDYVITYVQQ